MRNIAFGIRATELLADFLQRFIPIRGTEKGKYLLIPANICKVIPMVLNLIHQPFEYVDISKENFCIDMHLVLSKVIKYPDKYLGIIYVRTYGQITDVSSSFKELKCLNPDFVIIDDRCLCMPELDIKLDKNVDMLLYSTGYAKVVNLGYGSFAFTHNEMASVFDFKFPDLNFTYDQSVISLVRRDLKYYYSEIEQKKVKIIKHKKELNEIYLQYIFSQFQAKINNVWRFHLLLRNKSFVLDKIFNNGLFASSHYESLSEQAVVAIGLHDSVINLFNDFYFTHKQAVRICEIINKYAI